MAATADGSGGRHKTGVRWYLVYMVYGLGVNPIQPIDADAYTRWEYEGYLEDMGCWLITYMPSGRQVSAKSAGKYISETRAWYHRFYAPGVLGVGAEASRVPEILRGAARSVEQPPPLERHGCAPEDLRDGLDAVYPRVEMEAFEAAGTEARLAMAEAQMWRASLTTGEGALARGCELGTDDRESFDPSQHLLPSDVTFFTAGGVSNASMRMRKRKDLKVLRGKQADVVLAGGGSIIDPVSELERWLEVRRRVLAEHGVELPLFCWPSGRVVTTSDIRGAVRRVMAAAGRDPSLYGAHSLRIGGATAALAAGVPPQLIRLMGRWSSDVYEIYCRMSREAALRVGRSLTSTAVHTFEGGFTEERLELLPDEVAGFRQLVQEDVA